MLSEAEEESLTARAPRSQLPIRIAPFGGETLPSYLARLTAANYLQESFLKAEAKRHDFCQWLSLITGRTEHQLLSALPQLRTAATLDAFPHLFGLASAKALIRHVCTKCVLTRARPKSYPLVFATHEQVICMKHRRWVGSDGALSCLPSEQFSVANCRQIIVANQRHRRLILRWGRQEIRGRFSDALHALLYWRSHSDLVISDPKVAACRAALGIEDCYRPYLPKDVASWYPNTVALTEVFVEQDAGMKRVGVLDMDLVEAGIDAVSEKVLLGLKPSGARDPFLSRRREQPFEGPAEVEIPRTR
jgi:hypothetical protein